MIYLASSSPRRKALLKEAKIRFISVKTVYREEHGRARSPLKLTRRHAQGKALSAVPRVPNGIVLSADTVVFFDGKVLGKPKNMKQAFRMLGALSGRWHTVVTTVVLLKVRNGRVSKKTIFTETSRVRLKKMDKAALRRYFKRVRPLDKAGAYALQSRGASIVDRVRGSRTNVVGLPMEKLKKKLFMLG